MYVGGLAFTILILILCTAGFIGFYFFFLPGILVKRWLGSLEFGEFTRKLYWNENIVEISGNKKKHHIKISLTHFIIKPQFEITISLKDELNYNFFFAEYYIRNHKNWNNNKNLYKDLLNIYKYDSWARNAIVKYSNLRIRNALIHFLSSKFEEKIFDNSIFLEYHNLFFYPVLFFRKKYVQRIINETLRFSEILAYTTDDELIRENMEKEDNINLKILNMILLYTDCKLKKNKTLYEEYFSSDNKKPINKHEAAGNK